MKETTKIIIADYIARIWVFTVCGGLAIFFRNGWLIGLGVVLLLSRSPNIESTNNTQKEGEIKNGKSTSDN